MVRYIDALLLWVICLGLYLHDNLNGVDLCIMLLAFSLMCFLLNYKKRWVHISIGIACLIAAVLIPQSTVFLPLFVYSFFYYDHFVLVGISFVLTAQYFYIEGGHYWLIPVLVLLAIHLAWHLRKREEAAKALLELRDADVEKELTLKQTNQKLLESQNTEIYTATLKERNRIAREIHDNVGHSLSSSILQVGAMIAICKDGQMKALLETLKATLDKAMNNIRSSVHDLHDESIDLETALMDMINDFSFCHAELHCNASKHIDKNVKYCFIAVVKEALHNVTKHSDASKVAITVKEHPGFYQLLIEDNGTIGSKKNLDKKDTGIGLTNMQDRVDAVHGILNISRDKGFRIFISVPKETA